MAEPANNDDGLMKIKRIIFICVGAFIMSAAAVWMVTIVQFANTAVSARGIVTELNAGGSHPQVRFTAQTGEVVEYPQNGLIFGYEVGDEVRVLYQPEHPREATIDTFGARYGFTVMMFLMGAAFVGMTLLQKHRPDLVS